MDAHSSPHSLDSLVASLLGSVNKSTAQPQSPIRDVKYYPNPQATRSLVHIKDLHFDDAYSQTITSPIYDMVSDVQLNNRDIFQIMYRYTHTLFVEGEQGEVSYDDAKYVVSSHLNKIPAPAQKNETANKHKNKSSAQKKSSDVLAYEKLRYLIGAHYFEKLSNPFITVVGVSHVQFNDDVSLDKRKMFALEVISRAIPEQSLAVMVFGCLHTFGGVQSCGSEYKVSNKHQQDTLAYWNMKYPHKQFSLIEIIPSSLPVFSYSLKYSQPASSDSLNRSY
jgi:hypothetical protein